MTLKKTEIYDDGDKLGVTSEKAPQNALKEIVYMTQSEWEVLLMIDTQYIQDCVLDILEEDLEMKNDTAYINYKKNLEKQICPDLDIDWASRIKATYLNSKTKTMRTIAVLELMDEFIDNYKKWVEQMQSKD